MKILVIGEVFLEYFQENSTHRLGGIMHAANILSKINDVSISFNYIAPEYLQSGIIKELDSLGINSRNKIFTQNNNSNIVIINDKNEKYLNSQYTFVYSESREYSTVEKSEDSNIDAEIDAIIYFPTRNKEINEKLVTELNKYNKPLFIDLNYDLDLEYTLNNIKDENLYLLISVNNENNEVITSLIKNKLYTELVVRMNRGGSNIHSNNKSFKIPCYIKKHITSVGVGDAYTALYCVMTILNKDIVTKGKLSSYYSSLYASHQLNNNSVIKLNNNDIRVNSNFSVYLDWNERQNKIIYLAGPDFVINKALFNDLTEVLISHNFNIQRPIKINGEIDNNSSQSEKSIAFIKDLKLIEDSDICVAFYLNEDQGTLVELGIFYEQKKPIIFYDPNKLLNNMFLEHVSKNICHTVEDLIYMLYLELGDFSV